jgi:hypothetical protein
MQREKGNFLRGIRQGVQFMVMQADAPSGNLLACGVAREQFPRGADQHGAVAFRHAIQPGKDHQCRRTRPNKPRRQWPKMPRAGGEGAFRRRINRFQSAAWRKALCRGQHFRRCGGCLPRCQGKQRQRGKLTRLQTGSQQKTSPERSSAEKAGFSAGRAYSSIISGVQPSLR